MVATFVEHATLYGPCTTLADSLGFAWTSIYTRGSDADAALEWMKANVIAIGPVTAVHVNSPTWKETEADVPHERQEEPLYAPDDDYEY